MLLVYTHKITSRLSYIFNTIFVDVLNIKVSITSDVSFFNQSKLPKLNYSKSAMDNSVHFPCANLLFESTINSQSIKVFDDAEHIKGFFSTEKGALFSFDMFAASFYLLSRYEEYLPHKTDIHQRFLASESLAFKNQFLKIPIVNYWINSLALFLKQKFYGLKAKENKFNFINTLDIDNAYAIRNKGFLRTIGGILKSSISKNDTIHRIKVLVNKLEDPYDTFDYQEMIHKRYNISPIYFFLVGDYAKYDKSCPIENKTFQQLIKATSINNRVGIHPSYLSSETFERFKMEKDRLENIIQKQITQSRQHYLKLSFPGTYQHLIEEKIKEDYTMGFADENGFRAGIASPFYFYDLINEKATTLKIIPFCVMDATFIYYKNKSSNEAIKEIVELSNEVKKVKGTFVSVWHNETFSNKGIWVGWRQVYEKMINHLSEIETYSE